MKKNIPPFKQETPTQYADRLGVYYTSTVTDEHKKDLGQFFTPADLAHFMASFSKHGLTHIKILDPGCGIGILSAALVELLAGQIAKPKSIELVAFETDPKILPLSECSFKYIAIWLAERGIDFTFFLCKNDFILHNSAILQNHVSVHEKYDIVISNPPYFKLPKDDERAIAAQSVIYGQTNIYSIFLLIAAKLLNEDGQLIFITPRSFCSGNYFRLFRTIFFDTIVLKSVHLFSSRSEAFKRDKVLQENVIISAYKKHSKDTNQLPLQFLSDSEDEISLSISNNTSDLKQRVTTNYKYSDLINLSSYQKILHLPTSKTDEQVIRIFKSWTGSLNAYDLQISTGPVVDFRSKEMIFSKPKKNTVPLIWLHNVGKMKIAWPSMSGSKGKLKGQYIINNEHSISRLVDNKNLVLLRRFSSKDDNKRLVAAPYLKNSFADISKLGIENHLNYIYHTKTELDISEVFGLAAILNSSLFDVYFRTFNGNINVSATELRDFPLPEFDLIRQLGVKARQTLELDSSLNIDELMSETFNITIDLSRIYG